MTLCQLQVLKHFFSNYFCFLFVALLTKKVHIMKNILKSKTEKIYTLTKNLFTSLLKSKTEKIYTLTHENNEIFEGSELECFLRILNLRQNKLNPNCLDFALNYDNYKLTLKH